MKYNRSHLITIKYDITHHCHIKYDTGDECHVFEEAFNMDGTLRLHISQPVNGWISKLTGLITKISIDKSTKIPVSVSLCPCYSYHPRQKLEFWWIYQ